MWDGRSYRKEVHRIQGFMEIPNNMADGWGCLGTQKSKSMLVSTDTLWEKEESWTGVGALLKSLLRSRTFKIISWHRSFCVDDIKSSYHPSFLAECSGSWPSRWFWEQYWHEQPVTAPDPQPSTKPFSCPCSPFSHYSLGWRHLSALGGILPWTVSMHDTCQTIMNNLITEMRIWEDGSDSPRAMPDHY